MVSNLAAATVYRMLRRQLNDKELPSLVMNFIYVSYSSLEDMVYSKVALKRTSSLLVDMVRTLNAEGLQDILE